LQHLFYDGLSKSSRPRDNKLYEAKWRLKAVRILLDTPSLESNQVEYASLPTFQLVLKVAG